MAERPAVKKSELARLRKREAILRLRLVEAGDKMQTQAQELKSLRSALARCREETVAECAKVAKEIAECKYEEARNSRDRGQHPDATVYVGQHDCALKIEREIRALASGEGR